MSQHGGREPEERSDILGGPDRNVHEDELGGPDRAEHEDELGGPDRAEHEDELGGPDRSAHEDVLGERELAAQARSWHSEPVQSVYEAAGGIEGLIRLAEAWHRRVMADQIVSHAFAHGYHPRHEERLAAAAGAA